MMIQSDSIVGQLAAEHPLATRVFHRHGIDFCCDGGRKLQEACAAQGVDTGMVLEEIRKELSNTTIPEERWGQAPLEDLVQHILVAYHGPLKEELPRLESVARLVLEVHGDKDPETLSEVVEVFAGLKAELSQHMVKEEQILFPMIEQGQGAMAGGPVSVMKQEHDSAGAALRRLRELTKDYQVPPGACNTWRALWHGLAALEESLHQHIHLENNILFPRALGS
jgi:regulator of cell morphogenesis and NO signaling